MTFDPNAQLDPSQVTDARGGSRLGGRGGLAIGGGGLGLVIAIIYVLLGGNPGALVGSGSGVDPNAPTSSALASCKTGNDANTRQDCQIVGYVDSIQK
jgi:predicted metalloprotease